MLPTIKVESGGAVKKQRTYQSICRARPSSGSWLVLLILNALFGLTACGKEEAKPQARPPAEVSILRIEPRDVPVTVEFVAQTQSSHQVDIRARINGFLDTRVYTEGV
jgi:membrane fusion protein (multidrug efflux system)